MTSKLVLIAIHDGAKKKTCLPLQLSTPTPNDDTVTNVNDASRDERATSDHSDRPVRPCAARIPKP